MPQIVGKITERFLLPMFCWVLNTDGGQKTGLQLCITQNFKKMELTFRKTTGLLAVAIAMACPKANAQHWHHYPHRVVTAVERPVEISHVSNRLGQKERLAMAVAYLGAYKTPVRDKQMITLTETKTKKERRIER